MATIYDKPVHSLIRDMIKELASQKGQQFSREQAIMWFGKRYPEIKKGTISAHLIRFSTNAPSRLHHSVKSGEDLLFQVDRSRFRLYDSTSDPPPIHSKSDTIALTEDLAEPIQAQAPSEFAYESDLRDFLAKNLSIIEPSLPVVRRGRHYRD